MCRQDCGSEIAEKCERLRGVGIAERVGGRGKKQGNVEMIYCEEGDVWRQGEEGGEVCRQGEGYREGA